VLKITLQEDNMKKPGFSFEQHKETAEMLRRLHDDLSILIRILRHYYPYYLSKYMTKRIERIIYHNDKLRVSLSNIVNRENPDNKEAKFLY
jgi:hypothetical protein